MNLPLEPTSTLDRIRRNLVGLKMARALEVLDQTVRLIERGEIAALDAIDTLLTEELTLRRNRRVKMALMTARITAVKTLAGFDFAFQPSLDRHRILTLTWPSTRSTACWSWDARSPSASHDPRRIETE